MQGCFHICKSIHVLHHINIMKAKNHMIILINGEKAFDKIWHYFMIKNTQQTWNRGNYLNIIRVIYEKHTGSMILNSEKQSFASKIRNKSRMLTWTTCIQHNIGSRSWSNYARKKIIAIQIRKKELKWSLFVNSIKFYMWKTVKITSRKKKSLELRNELSKICMIQSQHTKISCVYITLTTSHPKGKWRKQSIYNSIK